MMIFYQVLAQIIIICYSIGRFVIYDIELSLVFIYIVKPLGQFSYYITPYLTEGQNVLLY